MLRIGYVRLGDDAPASDTAALKARGCHVVRAEEPNAATDEYPVLASILDFIGPGDELVVTSLGQLGRSGRSVLQVIGRLDARNAGLTVLEPGLSSRGAEGRALRAALSAVAAMEPAAEGGRRRPAAREIRELQAAGVGPVEIARRLGVSRMTVWRKLKADA